MSYYPSYDFVTPEPVFAEIREELRSYFDTGIVDDILFPVYTRYTLQKLGNGTRPVFKTILILKDYSTRLPEDFYKVRELYLCRQVLNQDIQLPTAIYHQSLQDDGCEKEPVKNHVEVIKTTTDVHSTVYISHLLKPGNVSARNSCDHHCSNLWAESDDTFDIQGKYIHTNIPSGLLQLKYYSTNLDAGCITMVPDLVEYRDYLKAYLKFKTFETIFNNTTDETFRQIEGKLNFYKSMLDDNFIIVKTEMMKKTPYQAAAAMKRQADMFRRYEIR